MGAQRSAFQRRVQRSLREGPRPGSRRSSRTPSTTRTATLRLVRRSTGGRVCGRWEGPPPPTRRDNPKKSSIQGIFLADVAPVPSTPEVLPGMRSIVRENVTLQPKVTGQGESRPWAGRCGLPASRATTPAPKSPRPIRGATVRRVATRRLRESPCPFISAHISKFDGTEAEYGPARDNRHRGRSGPR